MLRFVLFLISAFVIGRLLTFFYRAMTSSSNKRRPPQARESSSGTANQNPGFGGIKDAEFTDVTDDDKKPK